MLKPVQVEVGYMEANQPPSGGCVLKPAGCAMSDSQFGQPPSGGCVLKQAAVLRLEREAGPAALRRLCV